MKNQLTIPQKITLFLKGLAMGGANKVPGVSGGMVAFVLGFYTELIYSFQKVNFNSLKLLFTGRFKAFAKYTNFSFLTWIMLGSLFSYFSVSLILDYFIKNYELYVWSWFFGMIIGSIYYLSKDFSNWNKYTVAATLFGASVGVAISLLDPAKQNDNLWFVFMCGIIGVSGMTLPGLSGSFILILLGNYVLLLVDSVNALSGVFVQLLSGNTTVLQDPKKLYYLKIISVFTAGSAFGLVSISHVLGYIIKRFGNIVTAVIIGFITGSLGIVWPWKETVYKIDKGTFLLDVKGNKIVENYKRFVPNLSEWQNWMAIGFILFGVFLVIAIDYYGKKNNR